MLFPVDDAHGHPGIEGGEPEAFPILAEHDRTDTLVRAIVLLADNGERLAGHLGGIANRSTVRDKDERGISDSVVAPPSWPSMTTNHFPASIAA